MEQHGLPVKRSRHQRTCLAKGYIPEQTPMDIKSVFTVRESNIDGDN